MSTSVSFVLTLSFVTLIGSLVTVINSAPTYNSTNDSDGYCEDEGVRYRRNNKWVAPVGECMHYECTKDGVYVSWHCLTITFPGSEKCFQTPYNMTVQYPHCCPQWVCPEDASPFTNIRFDWTL